jgi:FkbM family methyltransferase
MAIELVEYQHGRLLYLPNDVYMGRFLREYGMYSPGEVEMFSKILRPGDIAIEVGACIGVHTIPMGRMVAPSGSVMAFEPQLHLYNLLAGNIALNALSGVVTAVCMAAGEEQGQIVVQPVDYELENNFGGCTLSPTNEVGRPVQMVPLDAVGDHIPALRLIKIDAEGMEQAILRGAQKLIRRCRPYLYFEDDREEKSLPLLSFARSLGYRLYSHKPFYVTGEGLPSDLVNLVSTNVLGVPEELKIKVDLEEL